MVGVFQGGLLNRTKNKLSYDRWAHLYFTPRSDHKFTVFVSVSSFEQVKFDINLGQYFGDRGWEASSFVFDALGLYLIVGQVPVKEGKLFPHFCEREKQNIILFLPLQLRS